VSCFYTLRKKSKWDIKWCGIISIVFQAKEFYRVDLYAEISTRKSIINDGKHIIGWMDTINWIDWLIAYIFSTVFWHKGKYVDASITTNRSCQKLLFDMLNIFEHISFFLLDKKKLNLINFKISWSSWSIILI